MPRKHLDCTYFFIDNFGIDPLIVSDDQMPQHSKESSTQNTLNFKCMDLYVKENNNLSRDWVTVFIQVCSHPNITFEPECMFKAKGTR